MPTRSAIHHRSVSMLAVSVTLAVAAPLSAQQAAPAEPARSSTAPATQEPATRRDEQRLRWRWRHAGLLDYAGLVLVGGAYLYVELGTKSPLEPSWTGGILFDDDVRDFALADTPEGRARAGAVSDWFTLIPQAAVWIDTLGVPLFTDRWNFDTAWQMTVINLQATAVTGLLSRAGHHFIGRQRPDVEPCTADPEYQTELCFAGPNAGFPSGHTSGAFVGAGLICAHHMNQPLYGGGVADIAACGVFMSMATGSAWLRLTSDRHYVSDVIVGAAIGAGAGWGLPELLFYSWHEPARDDQALRWTLLPMGSADTGGLAAYGWF